MTNKTDKHRNKSLTTTVKAIRWDNEDLAESKRLAELMGITWTAFVKEALKEKINKVSGENDSQQQK